MYPRLLEIPVVHLTIWSFGTMMAVGFVMALLVVGLLTRRAGLDLAVMSSAAVYSLIIGVVGARTFFVLHHLGQFRGNPMSIFSIWRGGLEFLGGAIPAVAFLLFYLHRLKLPVCRYLDIMAVGLMMGLAFGRIGCFLNGCCFGRPTTLGLGVRFPYGSPAHISQINPDPRRDRPQAYLMLPQSEYFGFCDALGRWYPKPFEDLKEQQQYEATEGKFRPLPVHPAQLYASAHAFLLCGVLFLLWRKSLGRTEAGGPGKIVARPGLAVAATFILYGMGRFFLEFIRDDNPYELGILTIHQILGAVMFVTGIVLLAVMMAVNADN